LFMINIHRRMYVTYVLNKTSIKQIGRKSTIRQTHIKVI